MDKNKIHLAILWHQHQPLYLEPAGKGKRFRFPWVRLHAIRDYYPMAALVAQYPKVHLTINLVPSLILQIEGYTEGLFMDRALELTLKPAKNLMENEKEEILQTFFDADWHHQIYLHPRYKELFERRVARQSFSSQDITDLQMWFNLGWFAPEFLEGETKLHDGTRFNLEPLIKKEKGFSQADIRTMIDAQYAVMRNIVPLHQHLQDTGQIEISTTPFYHPILPLIHDTDLAKAGSPAMKLPPRFEAPEDAQAQVNMAIDFYKSRFKKNPRGMWPAEGAVGQSVIDYFVRSGVRWIASDEGVLERSGKWGYRIEDPNVLCQPYRAEGSAGAVSIFFRDKNLSDAIGFKYQHFQDQAEAANAFIAELKNRLANHVMDSANRIVTIVLDGENAWSTYQKAARPFLHALYRALSDDSEIKTVTFSEYLEGNPSRTITPHPIDAHPKVYDLFHGSWIDAWGSERGVDLDTWIGEEEENRGWELVKRTREDLFAAPVSAEERARALKGLYAAEGSDWFWWFGADQESGYDDIFDDLFRGHLRSVYDAIKIKPPSILNEHIVPHAIVWTFTNPALNIQLRDRLTIRTNCAGTLRWSIDNGLNFHEIALSQAGGVMAGLHSYSGTLGPFPEGTKFLLFAFRCSECGCQGKGECCGAQLQKVLVESANRLEPETMEKIKNGTAP